MRYVFLLCALVALFGCSAAPPPAATPTVAVVQPTSDANATATPASSDANATAPIRPGDIPQLTHKPITDKDFTVPMYPGAKQLGGGRIESQDPETKRTAIMANVDLETKDSLDKVVKFYQDKMKDAMKTELQDKGFKGVVFRPKPGQTGSCVTISHESSQGPTHINIVNSGGT